MTVQSGRPVEVPLVGQRSCAIGHNREINLGAGRGKLIGKILSELRRTEALASSIEAADGRQLERPALQSAHVLRSLINDPQGPSPVYGSPALALKS